MRKLFFVGVLLVPFASYAGSMNKDNVIDKDANSVVDARGDCVRTKWEGGYGDCNGEAPMTSDEAEVAGTVYFNFDKDTLRADAVSELNALLSSVSVSDSTEANVTGFADRIGDSTYNNSLSKRRAMAVENYLAGKGISKVNTSVMAKGETSPITNCSDDMEKGSLISCLQEDRRVEISISE